MKIVIIGDSFEQIYEPADLQFQNLLKRIKLDLEIWNRDHLSDQRELIQAEEWPLPEPDPLPE